jgi:tyrosyl-tRNA synthetase
MKFIFSKKQEINTNEDKIEDFLSRGVEIVYPNKEGVKTRLLSGKKQKVYFGIDPTGPTLHIGHAIPLKKMRILQDMGHEIILLIGDFTAMIGDPTDKTATRKQLTRDEVLKNCSNYKKQAGEIISFTGTNPAKFVFNSKWLAKMNFSDVLNLASRVTVGQMLKRDMFEKRMTENKPIFIHEFMYPLMQGYDSVALDVDGEIGGNDQTFNMLMGRELAREISNKDKFILITKLLVDPNGKKMGKTEGNMVKLNDTPSDMFGKVMSWTDGMIIAGFELCTNVSLEEIEKNKKDLENGVNPRDIKIKLAKEIVNIFCEKGLGEKAEQDFINTFSKKGLPENIEEIKVLKDEKMADVLLKAGTVESKGEWRRLVLAGGVSNAETDEKITSPDELVKNITLKVGKKRFIRLAVSN